ncbi:MAG TPA: multicopper oxidase domain-containing protein [Gemmatimonadales bacterium]|jgi:nitrite reductase (NO-forming)|nr:multicopper oxidase domain-containing protein [Gemmatimonadales bacterium]
MTRSLTAVALSAAILAGCRGERATPAAAPPATPAADVSHGEAAIGAADTAPVDALAPARTAATLRHVRIEIRHVKIAVAHGATYDAWSFDGRVPGPFIRVTQGDTVDFTLVNRAPIPHSMDFHAAEVAPNRVYVNVIPGDSLHYRFIARVPGAFLYHCGTAPVAMHIANGMYGAIIVDPRQPRPAAREFVLVQSEFYTQHVAGADSNTLALDWQKLLGLAPDYVTFNGRAAQYATAPLRVKPGEPVRFYVVNAGPNRISAFHVVGAIFDRVFLDGSATATLNGVQTVDVPVGGGAVFELHLAEAGDYPFVTHAFADATKGAVGVVLAKP